MARGDILLKTLEILAESTIDTIDLFAAILSAGYGASYSKLEYELEKIKHNRLKRYLPKNLEIKAKQNYYKLIYKLKSDNLIREEIKNRRKVFYITKKGLIKLKLLKCKLLKQLPSFSNYVKNKTDNLIIVTFDVPEKEKRKREWLRTCLKNLNFRMIQKSVWMGKVKIPIQLLEDLDKLNMINFIEIFEVSKSGSLKKFT